MRFSVEDEKLIAATFLKAVECYILEEQNEELNKQEEPVLDSKAPIFGAEELGETVRRLET